ncbi:hypothetical protein [Prosthecobacter sp.]|uniref:hypothetical protein n=1 Tax=Prosthecobacter sp. TaxID=1965333 RepID=UPI001D3391D1|nr:hypothetical protein [Prosthecobacter sp.]MCB1276098.1 hypothetical protein [Prosthecobacter sp.]
MKSISLLLFLIAVASTAKLASAQESADALPPLTTADLVPLPSDGFDPTLPEVPATSPTAAAGPVDPDLPQPFDPATLTAVVENSPFTRIVSISDSLVLTGMAYVDGKPVVTIYDKTNKQSLVVSDEPNLKGWKLVSAQPADKIDFAQAKIAIGGESFSIRHSTLGKDDLKKDKSERRDGPPGPPPGGGERFSRSNRGPSEEDRKKYESLSDKAREKFRDALREKFSDEKFRNAPEEDRRNAVRAIFDKIEKQDKGGK